MTSKPSLMPSMVAAAMTPLMPGAGPPPTRMPNFPRFTPFDMYFDSSVQRFLMLLGQKFGDHGLLFLQFIDGEIDLFARKFIERHALDDLPFLPVRTNWERGDQILVATVTAVAANSDAVPIAARGGIDDRTHAIKGSIGGAGRAGG